MLKSNIFSKVVSTGSFLPGKAVTNSDLGSMLQDRGVEISDQWIQERTGILTRHFSDILDTSGLAFEASKKAISNSGLKRSEIGLVIVATTTPDKIFPSIACQLQKNLGIKECPAFDVQAVCTGFLYALTIADLFIRSGQTKHALVTGAEKLSKIVNWEDRSTCVLFGDGAGSVILSQSEPPGILNSNLCADGSFMEMLHAPGWFHDGLVKGTPFIQMDGKAVFKKAVEVLSKSAVQLLTDSGIELTEIDWYVPHQANIRIIRGVGKKLELESSKIVETVQKHANTSAASIPLALDTAFSDGRITEKDKVLLQGVGGGFTWGSLIFTV